MRTCVSILPVLLLGCGFASGPIHEDPNIDPRTWTSDGVVMLKDSATPGRPGRGRGDAAMAGSGSPEDAATALPDADVAPPDDADALPEDSGAMDAAPAPDDAAQPDSASDAAPDANAPDAEPPIDAHVPDYTDEKICQPCSPAVPCGPQSLCDPRGYCLPWEGASNGKSCADVCGGALPIRSAGGTCQSQNISGSCQQILISRLCWN